MVGRIVALAAVAVVAVGCGTDVTISPPVDPVENIEATVADGYADQKTVLVRSVTCSPTTDSDHFTCGVDYETADGVSRTASVDVACDASRCVWREQ